VWQSNSSVAPDESIEATPADHAQGKPGEGENEVVYYRTLVAGCIIKLISDNLIKAKP